MKQLVVKMNLKDFDLVGYKEYLKVNNLQDSLVNLKRFKEL
ncbi:MAG: hypothetical protein ACRDA4_10465 [Filifactoraceae bacterium]